MKLNAEDDLYVVISKRSETEDVAETFSLYVDGYDAPIEFQRRKSGFAKLKRSMTSLFR